MKRVTIILMTAGIICTCSVIAGTHKYETICGKVGSYFYPVDPMLKGTLEPGGWDCKPGGDTCLYKLSPLVMRQPPYYRHEVEPDLTTTSQEFYWTNNK